MLLGKLGVEEAEVEKRLNRFAVRCSVRGETILLHLRNTGRLLELIHPGARILYIPRRRDRTEGILVGVAIDGDSAALIDPIIQAHIFEGSVASGLLPWMRGRRIMRRESLFLGRRIDYLIGDGGRVGLLELKSAVFYSGEGYCMYPDTVSLRGRRHVEVLMRARWSGLDAIVVFVSAHPLCRAFRPCWEVDPEMASLLSRAREVGVEIYSIKLHMSLSGEIVLDDPSLPVELRGDG